MYDVGNHMTTAILKQLAILPSFCADQEFNRIVIYRWHCIVKLNLLTSIRSRLGKSFNTRRDMHTLTSLPQVDTRSGKSGRELHLFKCVVIR